jgi:hypothetical protein
VRVLSQNVEAECCCLVRQQCRTRRRRLPSRRVGAGGFPRRSTTRWIAVVARSLKPAPLLLWSATLQLPSVFSRIRRRFADASPATSRARTDLTFFGERPMLDYLLSFRPLTDPLPNLFSFGGVSNPCFSTHPLPAGPFSCCLQQLWAATCSLAGRASGPAVATMWSWASLAAIRERLRRRPPSTCRTTS